MKIKIASRPSESRLISICVSYPARFLIVDPENSPSCLVFVLGFFVEGTRRESIHVSRPRHRIIDLYQSFARVVYHPCLIIGLVGGTEVQIRDTLHARAEFCARFTYAADHQGGS